MTALGADWEKPFLPQTRDVPREAHAKKRIGGVPTLLSFVASSDWIANFVVDVISPHCYSVDGHFLRIAAFVTASENSCRHCYGNGRAALRMMGYQYDWIEKVERDVQNAQLEPREIAVLDFTRQLARSSPRPAVAERRRLAELGYSAAETAELAYIVASNCSNNRIATFLAVPPDEKLEALPASFMGRLMRPLIGRAFARVAPHPGVSTPRAGLFSRTVEALGNVPCALTLRRTIDGAFAAPGLSRRARALIFAVVARTIGCRVCEDDARVLLAEGGLDASEADAILTNLASPRLDAAEAALVPWARDTVRYQAAPMQRRTRALMELLGPQAALEAVGTASLANAVLRIAMLLE